MQTVTEHLRDHALDCVGYAARAERMPDLSVLRETEWPIGSRVFVELMQNRMVVGSFRYGRNSDPKKWGSDLIAGMEKKLAAYRKSGNIEHLVDLANYAQMEFRRPTHPRAHFRAEDDHHHCPPLDES